MAADQQQVLDDLLTVMTASALSLAKIIVTGQVAVFVHQLDPGAEEAARALGWDGKSPVLTMSNKVRRTLAKNLRAMNDLAAANWLERKAQGRIFVLIHKGTLCVNFSGGGYSIEPGTLNAGWMN